MSIKWMNLVWDESPYKGAALLIHLALADYTGDETGTCWPSQETLAKRSRSTAEYVRQIVQRMETEGWVSVQRGGRGGGVKRYRLLNPNSVGVSGDSSGNGKPNSEGAETPTLPPVEPLMNPTTTDTPYLLPLGSDDFDVDPFGRQVAVIAVDEPETEAKRAQRITKVYTSRVPLSRFPAVMGIVKKAIKAGYDDEQITEALAQLADEGRPVTVDTLRIQMEGLSPLPRIATARMNRSEVKVSEVQALIEGAAARDAARERKGVAQ